MDLTVIIQYSISFLIVYARWVVGGVLVTAGIVKTRDIKQFAAAVDSFRLTPRRFSTVVACIIAGVELAAGIGIASGTAISQLTIGALVLFGLFGFAVAVNLYRHNDVDCGCFGPYLKEKIGPKVLIRTMVLMGLSMLILEFYDGYFALESWHSGHVITPGNSIQVFLLVTALAVISGIAIVAAAMLVQNGGRVRGRAAK